MSEFESPWNDSFLSVMLLRNEQAMTAMLERKFKYACI